MLQKRTSHRDCISNYSQSFSNLHSLPLLTLDLKEFYLKKSLFNPPEGLAESFAQRRHIPGADVPIIDVIHYSKRWLLMQAPRFSKNFFRRLNSRQLGNPYQLVLKIFKSFVSLTSIYGYFKPRVGMIFMQRRAVCVWINEDVFQSKPMMSLAEGFKGQQQFVEAFLSMIQSGMKDWEKVRNIYTIEDTIKLLEWRIKLNRGSITAIKASQEVFFPPNESNASFEPHELGDLRKLNACRSVQEIEINQSKYFHPELSSSVTLKDKLVQQIPNQKPKISGLFSDSKDLKNSYNETKAIEFNNEVRRTKKKFNLMSTSSTLERFSEKWRSTVGKKAKKVIQAPESNYVEQKETTYPHLQHQNSEPLSIQHEFEGLFSDDGCRELKLGVEGDREELERITEQIEQFLIW